MNRFTWIKFGKLLIGAIASIFVANLLHLTYAYSAGIITLLSIQDTKKETLQTFGKRLLIFIAMTMLSLLVFPLLGYHLGAFAVILLPYLLLCLVLNMKEAIAPVAVLCTHYISSQSCDLAMIVNELLLLLIGAGVGIFLNLFFTENRYLIRREQESIEEQMRHILNEMAFYIKNDRVCPVQREIFRQLDAMLADLEHEAALYLNNHFSGENDYFYCYVNLRMGQCSLLKRIYADIARLEMIPEQASLISDYVAQMAQVFHETNNAEMLLKQLDALYGIFDGERLPESRKEFENRAILYHILGDLREFVKRKQTFYQKHQKTIAQLIR